MNLWFWHKRHRWGSCIYALILILFSHECWNEIYSFQFISVHNSGHGRHLFGGFVKKVFSPSHRLLPPCCAQKGHRPLCCCHTLHQSVWENSGNSVCSGRLQNYVFGISPRTLPERINKVLCNVIFFFHYLKGQLAIFTTVRYKVYKKNLCEALVALL